MSRLEKLLEIISTLALRSLTLKKVKNIYSESLLTPMKDHLNPWWLMLPLRPKIHGDHLDHQEIYNCVIGMLID